MKSKRMIVIAMTLVFLFGLITTANASFTDIDDSPHRDAIEKMTELGILEGVGNNLFAPERELNRAAAAKVTAFLLGYTEEDALEAAHWDPMFDDVYETDHEWAIGWINLVASEGVLKGYPEGEYKPGSDLQMVHWAAILSRILGYEEEGLSWPDDYNKLAVDLALTYGLDYSGTTVMNRAQMAQMTTTAIYDVEMPGGSKIIDIIDFETEGKDQGIAEEESQQEELEENENEYLEEVVYENVSLSVMVSKSLIPAGGGQTVVINTNVTHDNNLPAKGVPVGFFASQDDTFRKEQLSTIESITDTNGKVTATYTTLSADDDKYVSIKANVPVDDDWMEANTYILASDKGSVLEGRIINPFTGEPLSKVSIDICNVDNNNIYYMFENISDENGNYSIPVLPGEYHIRYYIDSEDKAYYNDSYTGSHHEFETDKMNIRVQMAVDPNNNYTLDTEMGIVKGVVNNLGSHSEIYLVRHDGMHTTSIANVKEDGSFIIPLREGNYEINAAGGHIINPNVKVEKGKVTDLGTFSR